MWRGGGVNFIVFGTIIFGHTPALGKRGGGRTPPGWKGGGSVWCRGPKRNKKSKTIKTNREFRENQKFAPDIDSSSEIKTNQFLTKPRKQNRLMPFRRIDIAKT